MTFICEICGKKNATEAGKTLHMKVYHTGNDSTKEKKPKSAPKPKKKEPVEKKTTKKSKKTTSVTASDLETITKEKRELYELVKKKFKQKPTGIEHKATVKKAELKKIFPEEMMSRVTGRSGSVNVHDTLEASYTAMVLTSKEGYRRVTLFGKNTKISWGEGMVNNKYRVGYPTLSIKFS